MGIRGEDVLGKSGLEKPMERKTVTTPYQTLPVEVTEVGEF